MLLKGILMVVIGLSGIILTIKYLVILIKKTPGNKSVIFPSMQRSNFSHREINSKVMEGKYISKVDGQALESTLDRKEIKSTVLLDEFPQDGEIEETVLLREDEMR